MGVKYGKYENDWYILGGAKTTQGDSYTITYLDTGTKVCGFSTASQAAIAADRAIEIKLIREKRYKELK
jgi:hypothetical protein